MVCQHRICVGGLPGMHGYVRPQAVSSYHARATSLSGTSSSGTRCLHKCQHAPRAERLRLRLHASAVPKTAPEDVSFSDKKAEQGLVFDAQAVGPTKVETARPAIQETDVVVIGSGIGGLCCAALLAKYGLKASVVALLSCPAISSTGSSISGTPYDNLEQYILKHATQQSTCISYRLNILATCAMCNAHDLLSHSASMMHGPYIHAGHSV